MVQELANLQTRQIALERAMRALNTSEQQWAMANALRAGTLGNATAAPVFSTVTTADINTYRSRTLDSVTGKSESTSITDDPAKK
jgi:hypothetical protein